MLQLLFENISCFVFTIGSYDIAPTMCIVKKKPIFADCKINEINVNPSIVYIIVSLLFNPSIVWNLFHFCLTHQSFEICVSLCFSCIHVKRCCTNQTWVCCWSSSLSCMATNLTICPLGCVSEMAVHMCVRRSSCTSADTNSHCSALKTHSIPVSECVVVHGLRSAY